jgi:hypothetical protein
LAITKVTYFMVVRLIFLVAISALPVSALADTFRIRLSRSTRTELPRWRSNVLSVGVWLGALTQVLVLGFMAQGFHLNGQSFVEKAPTMWRELNSISLVSWALVVTSVVLGKGLGKRTLLVWTLTIPLTAGIVIIIGMYY